jgi:hypothetical protein
MNCSRKLSRIPFYKPTKKEEDHEKRKTLRHSL